MKLKIEIDDGTYAFDMTQDTEELLTLSLLAVAQILHAQGLEEGFRTVADIV
jgi:hypothetical protein